MVSSIYLLYPRTELTKCEQFCQTGLFSLITLFCIYHVFIQCPLFGFSSSFLYLFHAIIHLEFGLFSVSTYNEMNELYFLINHETNFFFLGIPTILQNQYFYKDSVSINSDDMRYLYFNFFSMQVRFYIENPLYGPYY